MMVQMRFGSDVDVCEAAQQVRNALTSIDPAGASSVCVCLANHHHHDCDGQGEEEEVTLARRHQCSAWR